MKDIENQIKKHFNKQDEEVIKLDDNVYKSLQEKVLENKSDKILIGKDKQSANYYINFEDIKSTIITGNVGCGKTCLANNILCQIKKNYPQTKLFICDEKNCEYDFLKGKSDGIEIVNTEDEFVKMAEEVSSLLLKNKKLSKQNKVLIYIDEILFFAMQSKTVLQILLDLINLGCKDNSGIYLLASTYNEKELKKVDEIFKSFKNRLSFVDKKKIIIDEKEINVPEFHYNSFVEEIN